MDTPHLSRRHIIGTVALSAFAGCTASSSESGIQIGNIMIGNWRDDPVTITLRLDREGSTVFEEAIEIDDDGENLIEQSWDADPGEYTIMYSTEAEGRIYNLSLPEDVESANGDCIDIQIHCRADLTDIVFRDDSPPWGKC
ncbi:hypothetical protein ACFQO4_19350 [Saliphagus sp. GCM10025334]|uniref:hypothetical protein n=1 Tax=Natronosalvus caseinilyticus TaxID=2953747 RepID=UPI0028B16482|nr:hypothetical protein [Natronosalvus caseinilyticus]